MTVSNVRRGLKDAHLGPSWRSVESNHTGDAQAGDRSQAFAWVKRRLAWEHCLADLRERATATDDTVVGGGPDAVPLAE